MGNRLEDWLSDHDSNRKKRPGFYCYNQNNSGGEFVVNNDVAHFVIIEADSSHDADERAEAVGIYFDGCDEGRDCSCCGDRWYRFWGEPDTEPRIYGASIIDAQKGDRPSIGPDSMFRRRAIVYYRDGSRKMFGA